MDKRKEKIYLIFSICICFACILALWYYSNLPVDAFANAMEQELEVSGNWIKPELSVDGKVEGQTENTAEKNGLQKEGTTDLTDESAKEVVSLYERIVIIDAGHGGNDIGAQAILEPSYSVKEETVENSKEVQDEKKLYEKDLTLEIARRVGAEIAGKQIDVEYTRQNDLQTGIKERCQFIKEKRARLTLSIHADFNTDHMRHGIELYFNEAAQKLLEAEGLEKQQFAQYISDYTNEEVHIFDRAAGDGVLIYDVASPAVQVNLGYLSNVQDGKLLAREDYRKRLIKGITEATLLFVDEK